MNEILPHDNIPDFSWRKIFLPVAFGVGVSLYLIVSNFNPSALSKISFSTQLLSGLLLAILAVIVRDVAYIYRIHEITGKKLSWFSSFEVVMLWEFGSAVTPGAVGGVALALFILKKEGISFGRSTATILFTTLLDNMAFVLVFTVLYLMLGNSMFVVSSDCADLQGHVIMQGIRNLASKAWIGFAVVAGAGVLLWFSLFVIPNTARNVLYKLSTFKFLLRFQNALTHLGNEILITSQEFQTLPLSKWLKVLSATIVSWMARYALANALIFAFATLPLHQLEIFSRQYVLWVFLMIPSTPGASGLAEISFMAMNCEYIPVGLSATVALVWRVYSYYLYLIVGAITLPRWLKRVGPTT
jgi:uncharacterized membrane protein YbhN (UPF0104 family)